MNIMQKRNKNSQATPDRKNGVVIGIDVSKRSMVFGAFRPDEHSDRHLVKQDIEGLNELKNMIKDLKSQGYEPWIAFEPTGPYSACLIEWLISKEYDAIQVNPYHVKRTKEVRDNSPDKNDFKDPSVIADLVWNGCYN